MDRSRLPAVVTADRPADYVELRAVVQLESGTADLRVAAWVEDEEWGRRILALLSDALPVLERRIGLPYRHVGPLVVTESVSRSETSFDSAATSGAEILLAFDQPPFTALHEAAHIWIGPTQFRSRWIHEGLASYYAEVAGTELGVARAYDPVAVRDQNAALAFPLEAWPAAGASSVDQDRYGYPASWALAAEIAARAGTEPLGEVLHRVAAGRPAYAAGGEPAGGAPTGAAPTGVDGRQFLDHLEEVTGIPFDDLFQQAALAPDDVQLLDARRQAREGYRALEAAAEGWGAPLPVVDAMVAWEFERAVSGIADASAWLGRRDEMLSELAAAGLSAPERLRQSYVEMGGGAEAQAELDREWAVLRAYVETREALPDDPPPVERVGLAFAPPPAEQLAVAAEMFEGGDLTGASTLLDFTRETLEGASAVGALRIVTVGTLALLTGVALVTRLVRR